MRKGLTSYGDKDFSLFLRKAFIKAAGFSDDALDRPIIGITNTFSDFNPCHGNVPRLIEAVKRGVMLAGGMKSGWRVVANIGRHTLITLFLVYTAVFLVTSVVVYTVYR